MVSVKSEQPVMLPVANAGDGEVRDDDVGDDDVQVGFGLRYFGDNGYWVGGAGKIFHNDQPDPRSWDDYFPAPDRHMPTWPRPVPAGGFRTASSSSPVFAARCGRRPRPPG